MSTAPPPLAEALDQAIATVREELGDRLAPVVVVTPMRANAQLVERTLAARSPYIRVYFTPMNELVAEVGHGDHDEDPRRPEPAGWLEATLRDALPGLAADGRLGRHGATVSRPAWAPALAGAVTTLEGAGVDGATLRGLSGDGVADRAELLAALLDHVAAARTAEALLGPADVARRALTAATEARLPYRLADAGFVVVGDGALPYLAFEALRALLGRAPVVRLAIPPFEHVSPAPNGLRLAAADAPTVTVATPAAGALGHLQESLFRPASDAAPTDDGVIFAATPDEARETLEAVRVVQRAIDAGTPLDRIAIAAPDGATAELLGQALAKAQIPATTLVGPPLARSPEARFLALHLAIATGEELTTHWYEVLRHPGVRRSLQRDDVEVVGPGRWRRILASCGARRGTARVAAAVRRWAEARAETEDDRGPDDVAAAISLAAALDAYGARLDALPRRAPLGRHARAWRGLLSALPRGLGRSQLERVLEGLGAGDVGPDLSRDQAAEILAASLESSQVLRGSLRDRAIRVAPPMALLGAELDHVCVIGMNEGRFPRQGREDPLLTDDLGQAIAVALGAARLPASSHLRDAERRRFAAAVGAAHARLWLSVPRSDLMNARPAVPSALALEAATALDGERATFAALRRRTTRAGGRDRFAPDATADAISLTEHLIASLSHEDGLAALADHPWASRLLSLYRSIDRLHRPSGTPTLDAWSGHVPPETLAHPIDGREPVSADVLAVAVARSATYFLTHVLGAWRPRWFTADGDPAGKWTVSRWARRALVDALDSGAGSDRVAANLDALAAEAREHGDGEDADRVTLARALAGATCDDLVGTWSPLAPGARRPLDGLPLADDLPWRLRGVSGYRDAGGELVDYDEESQPPRYPEKYTRIELEGLALSHAGEPVSVPELRGVDGTRKRARGWSADAVADRARVTWAQTVAGVWPVAGSKLALHRERDADPEPAWIAALVAEADRGGDR